jgi:hypothetical protein
MIGLGFIMENRREFYKYQIKKENYAPKVLTENSFLLPESFKRTEN